MSSSGCPSCGYALQTLADDETIASRCPQCGTPISGSVPDSASDDYALASAESGHHLEGGTKDSELPRQIGRFECVRLLGQGGFGSVILGYDPLLDREVAIKISRSRAWSEARIEMLVHEARSAAQLRHPNIVAVHEVAEEDGAVHIVCDYIDGQTLSQRMQSGAVEREQAVRWCIKLARALAHAHAKGVVHRDLKPANIIVDGDNEPYISDFGLARRRQAEVESSSRSSSEEWTPSLAGTPGYMSPEQAASMASEATAASDIWSLGVILFELLTGERLYRGSVKEVLQQTVLGNPPGPRSVNTSVPKDLDAICLKCLEKNPDDRFDNGNLLADDLECHLAGERTQTRPGNPITYACGRALRHKWAIGLGALLVVAIIVASSLWRSWSEYNFNQCRVLFSVQPTNARVTIIPVDGTSGQLRLDEAIRPDVAEQYQLTLVPGWYVIEACAPNGGVQEVLRYATRFQDEYLGNEDDLADTPGVVIFRARSVKRFESDGKIVWPTVIVKPEFDESAWARFDGGRIQSGSDIFSLMYPMEEVAVAPYWLQRHEVTYAEYEKVMGRLPRDVPVEGALGNPEPASPAGYVTWWGALEYAERIGARLPTVDEYLFAATNAGETRFPWGNTFPESATWDVCSPLPAPHDHTLSEPPVFGLYSGVLEWTMTVPPPTPPEILQLTSQRETPLLEKRLIVGGGPSVGRGHPDPMEFNFGPRGFGQNTIHAVPGPGLGFRCARSAQPRFQRPNSATSSQ